MQYEPPDNHSLSIFSLDVNVKLCIQIFERSSSETTICYVHNKSANQIFLLINTFKQNIVKTISTHAEIPKICLFFYLRALSASPAGPPSTMLKLKNNIWGNTFST